MGNERTLSIIKPDATRRSLTGAINARIEAAGLSDLFLAQAARRPDLPTHHAEGFHARQRSTKLLAAQGLRPHQPQGHRDSPL